MLKNPEDRRARRTRRLLKESLLELMEQKHFSEISVPCSVKDKYVTRPSSGDAILLR